MPVQTPQIQTSTGISQQSQQLMAQKGGQRRQFAQDQFLQARQLQQQQRTDANNMQMQREQTAAQQAMQRQELDAIAAGKELDRQLQQRLQQAQIAAERESQRLAQDFERWNTKYGAQHAADLMRMEIEAARERQREEFQQRDKEAGASENLQLTMQGREIQAQKELQTNAQRAEKERSDDYYAEMRALQDRQHKLETNFKKADIEMAKARIKTTMGMMGQAMQMTDKSTKQTIAALRSRNEAEQKDGYLKAIKDEMKSTLANNPSFTIPKGETPSRELKAAVDAAFAPVLASSGLSLDNLTGLSGSGYHGLCRVIKEGKLSRADFEKLLPMVDGALEQILEVEKPSARLMSEKEYSLSSREEKRQIDFEGGIGAVNAKREAENSRKFLAERGKEYMRLKNFRASILATAMSQDPDVQKVVGEIITQYHGGHPGQLIKQMDDSGGSLDDLMGSVSIPGLFDVLDQLQGSL